MKPSEKRALDAERRAREAAEWREKELEKQAKKAAKKEGIEYVPQKKQEPTDTERIDVNAEYTKLPEGEIEVKGDGYHRESFFSNHVRLIAFIVTAVVVLFVIGPAGYDLYLNFNDYMNRSDAVEGKTMTAEHVIALAEKGNDLTWAELEKYEHTKHNNGKTLDIAIDGTSLSLYVERNGDSVYPDIVRLIDYTAGAYIYDIRYAETREIEQFIESPVNKDQDGEFDGKNMTVAALMSIVGKGSELSWNDLEAYKHTVSGGGAVMEINVSGTDLKISVRKNKGAVPPVRLIHNGSGDYLDDLQNAKSSDVDKFISEHTDKN